MDLLVISHACFMAINRRLYQLFLQEGWNIELVVPEELQFPAGTKKAQPAAAGDPPIHYLRLKGKNPRTYSYEGLAELLKQKRPAIILLDNDPISSLAGDLGKWCNNNQSALFCISCENLSLNITDAIRRRGLKNIPAALFKRWLLYRSRRWINGVFCINKEGVKIFREEGFRNVRHMPLGFDPAIFFPDDQARKQTRVKHSFNAPVIAYFGRLVPEKGIHILIKALQQLKSRKWHFMMDHFDEYASDYHTTVRQQITGGGLDDRVVFVHPDHVEIAAYMNAADIIVVPSVSTQTWKEQYGRVAAEGMACGKTVIASGSGALPDLINGHGLLFEEGNSVVLAQLLTECLTGQGPGLPDATEIATYACEQLSIQRQKEVIETALREVEIVVSGRAGTGLKIGHDL